MELVKSNSITKLPQTAQPAEIADRLGICRKTVLRWYYKNLIKGYAVSKKLILIDINSVRRYIENFKNY
ncbi:helix-turn-helix domain-containing protein [Candidatus Dependentiae bacterium]|nr:helix-turn-helix domain-containing protein [Candidatus Dependentiae bacterium]